LFYINCQCQDIFGVTQPPGKSIARKLQDPVLGWPIYVAAVTVAVAVLAAYANTFGVTFLLDDETAIVNNASIRHLGRLDEVLRPLNTATTSGRPILNLSFALNYAWSGLGVWSYHLVNLAVHIFAGLTLLGTVRRTLLTSELRSRFGNDALLLSALIAAIWTLHPLQTESVTYLSQRAESLMGLFYLLTLYFFVRSIALPRPISWRILSTLTCFCGMATKEVMVTAPLLVLLYDRAFISSSFHEAVSKRLGYYLGLSSAWLFLAFLIISSRLTERNVGFHAGVSCLSYALTELRVIVKYAQLSLWPHPLVFDYGTELLAAPVQEVLPFALLVTAAVIATAAAWRRSRTLGFLGAAFFVLLSPHSSVIPVAPQPMAESRMYLPLAAVVALVVLVMYAVAGRRSFPVFLAMAVGLGFLTVRRNEDYRSAVSIWSDTVAQYPESLRAHNNLAIALAKIPGRLSEAIAHYEQALRLKPDFAEAHYNLANALAENPGRLPEAIAHYEQALRLKPDYAEAHYNLANALAENPGRLPEAITHFEEALRLKPDYAEAHNNLAIALAQIPGRLSEAIAHYEQALRLKSDYAEAHNNLAAALAQIPGRLPEAITHFEEALRLKPDYAEAHYNLAAAYANTGRLDEAIRHLEIALRFNPDFSDARRNLEKLKALGGASR
jgi:tetratricopeptide (TPR) repeat protein